MYTLAIDTSTRTASIALLKDSDVIVDIVVNVGLNHSEVLLPAIDNIFGIAGIKAEEIDLYACTTGPGSFTGLRIGAGTVKGMALSFSKPIVGVSSLESLAGNISDSSCSICPMLDARKGQVYTALYRAVPGGMPKRCEQETVTDVSAFVSRISTGEQVVFLGDGAAAYAGRIGQILGDRALFARPFFSHIRASIVGVIGLEKYRRGMALDAVAFVPQYMRLSEAELNRSKST
jgi:tRNA threonylcarbamoyladenosine biosynthesis protein TsaB